MTNIEQNIIDYTNTEIKLLMKLQEEPLRNKIIDLKDDIKNRAQYKKNIFIMGNGGSGSTASHWMNDFNKGMASYKLKDEQYFQMICLNDNIPTMLAIANDSSYDNVFSHQLRNFIKQDDLVIGISGSGNSKNVINALELAHEYNCTTWGIVGFNGGKIKKIAKKSIHIETNNMGIFEDISLIIDHIMFDCYKNRNF